MVEASSTTTTTQHYGRLHLAALRPVTEFGGFSWNVLVQILITRCLNSRTLGVALQQADNGWIALGSLDELLEGEFAVHILVHLPEDLVCPLLRGRLVLRHLHH